MSVPTIGQQEIKALEQTRQRLSQLTHSLSSLHQQILQSDPLPPWSSLQSTAAIISQNLTSVSHQLNTHHDLFASMSVYPTPEFPGQTQEVLLGQLLRKKLEPNVEDWVAEGRNIAKEATDQGGESGLRQSELEELWTWSGMAANEQARKHTWGGNYTLEEIETGVDNVITGLRRKLKVDPDESSEEEEEEEEVDGKDERDPDEMEIVRVRRKSTGHGVEFDLAKASQSSAVDDTAEMLPLNDTFRFLMTGIAPPMS